MEEYTKVGIGVFILKDGKVLLGKRKGAHGAGEFETPGGHLKYMESFTDCAIRETKEECGIEITNIKFLYVANLKVYAPKHYVHIELIADWKSGEPMVLEPDKKDSWGWYDLDNLPEPLFEAEKLSLKAIRTGEVFYD